MFPLIVDPTIFTAVAICLISAWLYRVSSKGYPTTKILRQALLFGHSIYLLKSILVTPPRNVFLETNSTPNTPADSMRAIYLHRSPSGELEPELEGLFRKLNSFDMRLLYLQLGHDAVAGCDYCHSFEEYASFAFARPVFVYILEIGLVGAFTLPNSPRAHLRSFGIGILIVALVAEVIATLTASQILTPGGMEHWASSMWHDLIHLSRTSLFLVLPLILHAPRPPLIHSIPILGSLLPTPDLRAGLPRTAERLQSIQRALDNLIPRLHLISYTRAAILRGDETRKRAERWWSKEGKEGKAGIEDAAVKRTAKGMGLAYDEEPMVEDAGKDRKLTLRENARKGVETMFSTVPPSENWVKMSAP
ncbi:hypothetical protein DFP72DRAFT_884667 [Ephemerocybe angulata]|uniref:Uncharacterized protein n=1 Tax=Ephemerocybe angulata TaxID=980116 RepID=A0A8H6I6P0_9AGAR|nr:hypothetical protein DFP72DRAFT_884667 [Tulosesus angulatus]